MLKLIDDLQTHYTAHPALAQECIADPTATGEAATTHAAWTVAVNTLYNLDETKTRE